MEISFDTQYKLQDFRDIEFEYFCPDDNKAYDTPARHAAPIMEQMLELINNLSKELYDFQKENESLRNEIGVLHKGMSRI